MQLSEVTIKGLLVQRIRDDIIRGKLAPGQRLRLRDLAESYDVSTQPIRQALSELESEGLVVAAPRKGAMVAALTVDELHDIYEVRSTLEAMATKSAIEFISAEMPATAKSELLAELTNLIIAMDEHIGEIVELVALNKKFHLTLYTCSGRHTLCDLISTLRNRTSHYLHAYMIDLGGMPPAQDEHRAIVEACRIGDVASASSIMHDHVMKAGVGIIDYVKRENLSEPEASV